MPRTASNSSLGSLGDALQAMDNAIGGPVQAVGDMVGDAMSPTSPSTVNDSMVADAHGEPLNSDAEEEDGESTPRKIVRSLSGFAKVARESAATPVGAIVAAGSAAGSAMEAAGSAVSVYMPLPMFKGPEAKSTATSPEGDQMADSLSTSKVSETPDEQMADGVSPSKVSDVLETTGGFPEPPRGSPTKRVPRGNSPGAAVSPNAAVSPSAAPPPPSPLSADLSTPTPNPMPTPPPRTRSRLLRLPPAITETTQAPPIPPRVAHATVGGNSPVSSSDATPADGSKLDPSGVLCAKSRKSKSPAPADEGQGFWHGTELDLAFWQGWASDAADNVADKADKSAKDKGGDLAKAPAPAAEAESPSLFQGWSLGFEEWTKGPAATLEDWAKGPVAAAAAVEEWTRGPVEAAAAMMANFKPGQGAASSDAPPPDEPSPIIARDPQQSAWPSPKLQSATPPALPSAESLLLGAGPPESASYRDEIRSKLPPSSASAARLRAKAAEQQSSEADLQSRPPLERSRRNEVWGSISSAMGFSEAAPAPAPATSRLGVARRYLAEVSPSANRQESSERLRERTSTLAERLAAEAAEMVEADERAAKAAVEEKARREEDEARLGRASQYSQAGKAAMMRVAAAKQQQASWKGASLARPYESGRLRRGGSSLYSADQASAFLSQDDQLMQIMMRKRAASGDAVTTAAAPATASALAPTSASLAAQEILCARRLAALGFGDAFEVGLPTPKNLSSLGVDIGVMEDSHGLPEVTAVGVGGLVAATGKIQPGDVITHANGIDVSPGPDVLSDALTKNAEPGSGTLTFTLRRSQAKLPATMPIRVLRYSPTAEVDAEEATAGVGAEAATAGADVEEARDDMESNPARQSASVWLAGLEERNRVEMEFRSQLKEQEQNRGLEEERDRVQEQLFGEAPTQPTPGSPSGSNSPPRSRFSSIHLARIRSSPSPFAKSRKARERREIADRNEALRRSFDPAMPPQDGMDITQPIDRDAAATTAGGSPRRSWWRGMRGGYRRNTLDDQQSLMQTPTSDYIQRSRSLPASPTPGTIERSGGSRYSMWRAARSATRSLSMKSSSSAKRSRSRGSSAHQLEYPNLDKYPSEHSEPGGQDLGV